MKEQLVHETHFVFYDGYPQFPIEVHVDATYKFLDDGFATVDYVEDTIDYVCIGEC